MNLSSARKFLVLSIFAASLVTHARGQANYSYLVAPNTQNTGQTTGGALLAQSSSSALVTSTYYSFGGFNDAYAIYGGGNNPTTGGAGGTITYGTASFTTDTFTAAGYSGNPTAPGTAPTYVVGNNPSAWAANTSTSEWIAATPNQNNNSPGTPPGAPGSEPGIYTYYYSFTEGGTAGSSYQMKISGTVFADNGVTVQIIGSGGTINGGTGIVTLGQYGTALTASTAGGTIPAGNVASETANPPSDLTGGSINSTLTLQAGYTYILIYTVSNYYQAGQAVGSQTVQNAEGLEVGSFSIQYVPEPSTYAAWLMAGVLAVALVRRMIRKGEVPLLV
jgi:hypothetical protein